jgi:hypothetical protein
MTNRRAHVLDPLSVAEAADLAAALEVWAQTKGASEVRPGNGADRDGVADDDRALDIAAMGIRIYADASLIAPRHHLAALRGELRRALKPASV